MGIAISGNWQLEDPRYDVHELVSEYLMPILDHCVEEGEWDGGMNYWEGPEGAHMFVEYRPPSVAGFGLAVNGSSVSGVGIEGTGNGTGSMAVTNL